MKNLPLLEIGIIIVAIVISQRFSVVDIEIRYGAIQILVKLWSKIIG
ncbi:hypothetical protein LSG31_10275 [Fodinisporobacter ferrooxydans]|uniref:Flagellin Flp1-like domain-containing protein n=1 Tax=Fodinisporobacter ferrooxydans TaxID=2901836 RepID=A0ABY4CPS9_9BACL|nr:hypothetical protein LSG31_10275 [Alicyclobacillaceae bacterium MYW30-H2]